MKPSPRKRFNHIAIYCDNSDLKYAEAFLRYYAERVTSKRHDGQTLTIEFDVSDLSFADAALVLESIKCSLSKCIRQHAFPSKPPPPWG